jgi:Na+-driven multidrug efflux pump
MQTVPGLIAGPYIKNLYRISSSSYKKIQFQFSIIGIVISSIFSLITYFAVTLIYHFNLPLSIYVFGFLYGLLTYFYMLQIYLLFKDKKQNQVMLISIISIVINFILCFVFIPLWGIQGAVIANVLSQIVLFIGYRYYWKSIQPISVK